MTIDDIRNFNLDECKKFASFAHDKLPMAGTKKRLDEVLNQEIVIFDFRITKSTKREGSDCLQLQFLLNGEVYILFTGSVVLLDQIQAAKENMPFKTTIIKIDKYYSFS